MCTPRHTTLPSWQFFQFFYSAHLIGHTLRLMNNTIADFRNQELYFVRDGILRQGLSNLNFERP